MHPRLFPFLRRLAMPLPVRVAALACCLALWVAAALAQGDEDVGYSTGIEGSPSAPSSPSTPVIPPPSLTPPTPPPVLDAPGNAPGNARIDNETSDNATPAIGTPAIGTPPIPTPEIKAPTLQTSPQPPTPQQAPQQAPWTPAYKPSPELTLPPSLNLREFVPDLPGASQGSKSPSQTTPPVASPPAASGPKALPLTSYPVVYNMLQSSMQNDFVRTNALSQSAPKKSSPKTVDKKAAQQYNETGKDIINKQDKPLESLPIFETAYNYDRLNSEIVGNYGFALYRAGQYEQARGILMESLEIKPNYSASWFVLGQVFGHLDQPKFAYASFVNTCLFSRKIQTSLQYVETQTREAAEPAGREGAQLALPVCRSLAQQAQSSAAPTPAPTPAPPVATPSPAPNPNKPGALRFAKANTTLVVMQSNTAKTLVAKVAALNSLPKAQAEARKRELQQQAMPTLVRRLLEFAKNYAVRNNYTLIIDAKDEEQFRRVPSVTGQSIFICSPDPATMQFLNSPEGLQIRARAPIPDVTPQLSELFANQ